MRLLLNIWTFILSREKQKASKSLTGAQWSILSHSTYVVGGSNLKPGHMGKLVVAF